MANIKVLFVNPNPRNMSLLPPIAALFYSIFRNSGIEMKYFDTTLYDVSDKYSNPDDYKKKILGVKEFKHEYNKQKTYDDLIRDFRCEVQNWRPCVIMVSAVESTITFSREILNSVREFGIPHVLGGVFATHASEVAIKFDEFDIICIGEGEPVIVPLCQKLASGENLSDIPNIWIKNNNGGITKNKLLPPVDLNNNPQFDVSVFDESRFYRAMAGKTYRMFPVETHRGCPCKCTFCNSPIQESKYKSETGKRYFRKKSIKNVMKDVYYFADDCKAEYLFFWADNFLSYSRGEIDEFCKMYAEIRLPFYIQSYPVTIDEYKIKKLKDVNLNRIGVGVEHGNEEFRRKIVNRRYSNKSAIEGIEILKKHDIQFSCNNIVGFPTETPDLHMDTVMLNRILQPHTASCSIFTPFYGTYLRDLSLELGFLKDPGYLAPANTEYSCLDMPNFTKDQILGKSRTFNLYLKFPENRWYEIKKAEEVSSEGNKIWAELREEYLEKFN